ncbi:MAG: hypothetical protein KIS78_35950 [Labilithrix sp.]|nr:hypothetical protein [Labilithrix sp.]MCW5837841.1 hypothetical protein [Labilithrix sp.]
MLKKLIVAVLACVTIFLSRRALLEPQLRAGAPAVAERDAPTRGAAVAYGAGGAGLGHEPPLAAIRGR